MHWGECNWRILLVGDTLYCFKLIFHWECDVNVLEMHCYTGGECNRRILLVGDKSRWQGGAAGLHYTLLATPHFNCSCIIYDVYFNRTLLHFIPIQCRTSIQLLSFIYIVLHCTLLQYNVTPQFNYFIALSGTLLHWAIIHINSAALGHFKCESTIQYSAITNTNYKYNTVLYIST